MDAGRLPSQEPEVLVEARREIGVDAGRDLAPARTHPEHVVSRGVDIDVNAYLALHVPPSTRLPVPSRLVQVLGVGRIVATR